MKVLRGKEHERKSKASAIKNPGDKEKVEIVKQRIIQYQGDMKPLVLDLVEKRPDICDVIVSYLSGRT